MKPHKIDFFSSPANNSIGFQQVDDPQKDYNFNQQHLQQDEYKTPKREPQFRFSPIFNHHTGGMPNQFLDDPQQFFKIHNQDQTKTQKRLNKIQRKLSFNQKQQDEQNISMSQQLHQAKKFSSQRKIDKKQKEFFDKNLKNYDFCTPIKKINPQQKGYLESSQKSIKGFQKGLRRLSYLSYEIVNQLGSTSYKEVAQKLLQKMNMFDQIDQDDDKQDRSGMRNVKRRVYDSLNVLISLGVLNRNGNRIVRIKPKRQSLLSTDQQEKKLILQNQINKKQFALLHKRKILHLLQIKTRVLQKIMQRNKMMISKEKFAQFQSEKIDFPFLVIVNPEARQQSNIKINYVVQTKKKQSLFQRDPIISSVNLQFSQKIQAYGDLDSMLYLIDNENQMKNYYQSEQQSKSRMIQQQRISNQKKRGQRFSFMNQQNISEEQENEGESSQFLRQKNSLIKNQQPIKDNKEYIDPQRLIDEVFNHTPPQDQ